MCLEGHVFTDLFDDRSACDVHRLVSGRQNHAMQDDDSPLANWTSVGQCFFEATYAMGPPR